MNKVEGQVRGDGVRIGIVIGRFNQFIGDRLLEGAVATLTRHGVDGDGIDVVYVPGAFEIPLALRRMADGKRYQGLIALGCVIRGATPHFDYVSAEVSKGIAQVSLENAVPVIFGILTTDTVEQAIERAGTKSGNKGWSAAMAAVEMANLMETVTKSS